MTVTAELLPRGWDSRWNGHDGHDRWGSGSHRGGDGDGGQCGTRETGCGAEELVEAFALEGRLTPLQDLGAAGAADHDGGERRNRRRGKGRSGGGGKCRGRSRGC